MARFSASLGKAAVTVTRSEALDAASQASGGDLARTARLVVPRPRAAEPASGATQATQEKGAVATKEMAPAATPAATTPADNSAESDTWLRPVIAIAAIVAVLIAWLITVAATHDNVKFGSLLPKPVTGTTIFAVFFVAAAGVERLLEPIAGLLPDKSDLNKDAQAAKVKAGLAVAGGQEDAVVNPMLKTAAQKAVYAKDWVFGQTVGFWALATIISIVASALLKLYLPYVVGIASGGRAFQILATGLIIGGGTKPLHELVGYMTAAKDAKQPAK